jgi:hypothetical protein
MSRAYGGILSALDVHYSLTPKERVMSIAGTLHASFAGRRTFIEKETIYAIYPHKQDLLVSHEREIVLGE